MKQNVNFYSRVKFILSVVVLICFSFLVSCNKCPGDAGATNSFDSGLFFELQNAATGENLLNLFFGPYNQDTVKILREDLTKEPSLSIDASGRAWFRCLEYPKDLDGLNRKITKSFFLYLDRFDTDTIRIEFTLRDGDCPDPDFKEVNVFFNNILNTSGTNPGSTNQIRYQIFKKPI
jgi:hypothetical protein